MKIYGISDLHLTSSVDKPMDIFGPGWVGHWDKIRADWAQKVREEDVVLIPGDISWGMTLDQALEDLKQISELKGTKVISKGNHDYWWQSYSKICNLDLPGIFFLQNNAKKIGDYVFCGTRGWAIPDINTGEEDKKIFYREVMRLELSLKEGKRISEGAEIIGMMHYPPFNAHNAPSPFTDLFSEYGVKKVVYGHLHGEENKHVRRCIAVGGVDYLLISCDYLDNKLTSIY